jgi:cytochrome c-type biogenesis protein CcmH/NrfG
VDIPEPAAEPLPAPVPAEAAAVPAVSPEESRKAARKSKQDSQQALDRGDVAKAISAGELSVSADAEDGESWLILGAAYQQKGDNQNARRCFAACLKEGKRGPKGECAAMLR